MNTWTDLRREMEEFVHQAMQNWNVPGLALTLVKDDQVLLGQGRVVEFHVKIREDWIDPLKHIFKKQ